MFWRRREREAYEERTRVSGPLADSTDAPTVRHLSDIIKIERDAPRAASISRVAEELGRRGAEYPDATFEVLGAYPVPYEVRFFCGRSPAALLQLALVRRDDPGYAEACSEGFRTVAERLWGLELDYDPGGLSRVERLLLSSLGQREGGGARVPILDA